jgi:hypothetical protein
MMTMMSPSDMERLPLLALNLTILLVATSIANHRKTAHPINVSGL